jgi:hypothetical protein
VAIPNEKLQQVATIGDVVTLLNEAGPAAAMAAATPVPAGAEA